MNGNLTGVLAIPLAVAALAGCYSPTDTIVEVVTVESGRLTPADGETRFNAIVNENGEEDRWRFVIDPEHPVSIDEGMQYRVTCRQKVRGSSISFEVPSGCLYPIRSDGPQCLASLEG